MTFRAQTSNWRTIVLAHVETVIVIVHRFIMALQDCIFVDQGMREKLWDSVLLEKLDKAYRRAKDQAEFLLDTELHGRPSTYNHSFNDNLQKARIERLTQAIRRVGSKSGSIDGIQIGNTALTNLAVNKSNPEQVREDIHDILKSYYKVSRKRFVDVICRLVVENCLMDGSGSPLKVLTPELISEMSDDQLDMIAGEDAATRRARQHLKSEIKGLEAAMKVLRG
jgi:hypothetical protein